MSEVYPKVSFVVINAKSTEHLEKCLKSLVLTDYPRFEIIIVDCQTPKIEKWVAKHFKGVKLVHFKDDIGSSASHNVGVSKADPASKYIAFLDNDTVVEPRFLNELIEVMEKDDEIGVAQAKILKKDDEKRLDHTGLAIDSFGTWSTTFNMREKDFNQVFEIFAASLAACATRRDVFNEAGGFDGAFFISDDDTDFCWRARLLGYKVVFVPLAKALHSGNISKALNPKRLYHSAKNRACIMIKNYELKNLWWRVSVYYALTLLCASAFTLLLRPRQAHALIKGLAYSILNLNTLWKKRLGVQIRRRVNDKKLFQEKLLRKDVYPTLLDVFTKAKLAR